MGFKDKLKAGLKGETDSEWLGAAQQREGESDADFEQRKKDEADAATATTTAANVGSIVN